MMKTKNKLMRIRNATIDDLDDLVKIEQECFPPSEAAKKKDFEERLKAYPNHFWILEKDEKIISFIDGFVTNEKNLSDEMYENANMHDENGNWQMIFGVNTLPEYRKRGYAGMLIKKVVETAKKSASQNMAVRFGIRCE